MALLNDPASLPTPMWIVARYLASSPSQHHLRDVLRTLLSPSSLLPHDKRDNDSTFEWAVRTLQDLDIVRIDSDKISLSPGGPDLRSDDVAAFNDLLRHQVLDPSRNATIADGDQTGPKDLVRALSWFLTLDPFVAMSHADVVQRQRGALAEHVGNPLVNDFRWNRFTYWAPALGFAAPPLIPPSGSRTQTLAPDCVTAVLRTVRAKWTPGTRLPARDMVTAITDELPVLPGGRYSVALGLPNEAPDVSAALSFALLCGDEYGWLKLDRRSDADDEVLLVDPDRSSQVLRITHVEIQESANG